MGHYVSGGALRTVTRGNPCPGRRGRARTGSPPPRCPPTRARASCPSSWGAGRIPGGATLLAGPYGGELAEILPGRTFSVPSVAATREEAWVVRDGTTVVRVQAGAPPQAVSAPTLPGLGLATALRLSPDGVRAAVVVEGPEGLALYVGTVVRADDGSVALRDLRDVAPSLSQVSDVAWRDSDTLLVLAGDAGEDRIVPYDVSVDGWGLVVVPPPGCPASRPRSARHPRGSPSSPPVTRSGSWPAARG